ncbi:nephrin [Trichonephila clavipes]|nr:nephrin [Trichonephila clavipes]
MSFITNVKPVTVSVKGKRKRLSAGKIVQFECEARGSRPPAVITWRKGSTRLKSSVDKMTPQGNISTSILTMTPSSEDNGKFISCQADNLQIPGSAIEDSWKLEVHCSVAPARISSQSCRHCWRSPLPHASALIQREFGCVLGVQQTKQLPHVAKVDLVWQLGV